MSQPLEERLHVLVQLIKRHALNRAHIDTEFGRARIDAEEDAPLKGHTEVDGRLPAGARWMAGLELTRHTSQNLGELYAGVDRRHPIAKARVHLRSERCYPERGHAARGDGHVLPRPVEARRFADHHRVGANVILQREVPRAEVAASLFVRAQGYSEGTGQCVNLDERSTRIDHRGHRPLHVGRAESVEDAVAHDRVEGRRVPLTLVASRLRVHVTVEHQDATTMADLADEVWTRLQLCGRAQARVAQTPHRLAQQLSDLALVTRRVWAGRGNQFPCELDQLLLAGFERLQYGLPARRRRVPPHRLVHRCPPPSIWAPSRPPATSSYSPA